MRLALWTVQVLLSLAFLTAGGFKLTQPIPDLVADADRLTQVFLNLARNALQAMDQAGGTLTVSTRMLLEGRLVASDGRPTPTVELTFSDTGSGISPDILDRLATPFFTTKSTGTGLGLAVSRHWISRHGGRIQIENDPKGIELAKSRLLLPALPG